MIDSTTMQALAEAMEKEDAEKELKLRRYAAVQSYQRAVNEMLGVMGNKTTRVAPINIPLGSVVVFEDTVFRVESEDGVTPELVVIGISGL